MMAEQLGLEMKELQKAGYACDKTNPMSSLSNSNQDIVKIKLSFVKIREN